MRVSVRFVVAAAHWLPNYSGKCSRLHGHNYEIWVHVDGVPDPQSGMVVDFHEIEAAFKPLFERIDHRLLNDVLPNPTAELLAIWVWDELAPKVKLLCLVEVDEMDGYRVAYSGR